MSRRGEEEMIRVHINMPKRDLDRVKQLWGESLGVSKAVSSIVRKYIERIERKAAENAKPVPIQVED